MAMTLHTHLSPLVALIAGILILIFPRFLNYFIAIYTSHGQRLSFFERLKVECEQ